MNSYWYKIFKKDGSVIIRLIVGNLIVGEWVKENNTAKCAKFLIDENN
jgi:hypothetical protein